MAPELDGRRMREHGNLWRLILPDKSNTTKKSSWDLDVFHEFHLFRLWQAFLKRIYTFSSFLRVPPIHYDDEISIGYLVAEGLENVKNLGKRDRITDITSRFSCHPNGTRTRDLHYMVTDNRGESEKATISASSSPMCSGCYSRVLSSGKNHSLIPINLLLLAYLGIGGADVGVVKGFWLLVEPVNNGI